MTANLVKKFKEKNLASRVRKQDQEAFIEVYNLYVDDIYRFIYFKVGHKEEAQDVSSTVFLKAWNYINTNKLDANKSLKALLYKIARNSVVDYYRQADPSFSLDQAMGIKDESQDIEKEIDVKVEFDRISVLLKGLKEEYREIIVLRHLNELNWDEISQTLGKSRGNLRVLLHRALKALREAEEKNK